MFCSSLFFRSLAKNASDFTGFSGRKNSLFSQMYQTFPHLSSFSKIIALSSTGRNSVMGYLTAHWFKTHFSQMFWDFNMSKNALFRYALELK